MRVALSPFSTFVPIVSFATPIVAALSFAGGAHAQTSGTFLLTSTNAVSPSSPTTTIEIWAAWDDPSGQFAFGGADYDLTAGDGAFSNPVNVLNGPGSTTGVITGNEIRGALVGQILICGFARCLFSYDNPILLATYDWTATDFTPRTVDLQTSNTSVFNIAIPYGRVLYLYPNEFTLGSGVINVVPAPASWLIAGLVLAAGTRRRRGVSPMFDARRQGVKT